MKISEELEKEKAGPKSGKIPVRQDSVKLRKKYWNSLQRR
jgi:hypothetical protein